VSGSGRETRTGDHAAKATYVFRENWSDDHRPYTNLLHDDEDRLVGQVSLLRDLFAKSGAQDGDEIEIIVKRTGSRPFGERRIVLKGDYPNNAYLPETDEEMEERLGRTEKDGS